MLKHLVPTLSKNYSNFTLTATIYGTQDGKVEQSIVSMETEQRTLHDDQFKRDEEVRSLNQHLINVLVRSPAPNDGSKAKVDTYIRSVLKMKNLMIYLLLPMSSKKNSSSESTVYFQPISTFLPPLFKNPFLPNCRFPTFATYPFSCSTNIAKFDVLLLNVLVRLRRHSPAKILEP